MFRRFLSRSAVRSVPKATVQGVAFLGSLVTLWYFFADIRDAFFAPTPITGKARAAATDLGWMNGQWCGVQPSWNEDRIGVEIAGASVMVTVETMPVEITDGTGRPAGIIAGTRVGPADVAFWLDGPTGAIRKTDDGGFEMWGLTVANTLATIRLNEDPVIQKEFARCG